MRKQTKKLKRNNNKVGECIRKYTNEGILVIKLWDRQKVLVISSEHIN
jgi:hypothetical protein